MAKKRQIIFPSDKSTLKEKSTNVSLTHVDKKSEEEHYQPNDNQNIIEEYESDNDLTRRLTQIIKHKEIPDLLGVFGIYYDNKVKKSLKLLNTQDREILCFSIDIDYEEMDIYNCITAVLYNYLNEKGYSIQSDFSYYAHEIIQSYEYMEDTPIIIFINLNSAFLNSNMLQMLEKIKNKDMIFILGSLQNENAQINHLDTMSINMGRDLFFKYFYPQNIFNSPQL